MHLCCGVKLLSLSPWLLSRMHGDNRCGVSSSIFPRFSSGMGGVFGSHFTSLSISAYSDQISQLNFSLSVQLGWGGSEWIPDSTCPTQAYLHTINPSLSWNVKLSIQLLRYPFKLNVHWFMMKTSPGYDLKCAVSVFLKVPCQQSTKHARGSGNPCQ